MRKDKSKASSKKILLIVISIIIIIAGVICIYKVFLDKDNNQKVNQDENVIDIQNKENAKVDIINLSSDSRPYAIVVNNTAVAVKVQEGLNKAYLVYEIPTEGNTSRLLALYKDIQEDVVIGTIRSARHNFIDFALESDAIFCCFGWSHYAEDDLKAGTIDYMQGLFGGPFYRKNPENLASEHTAYTSMNKLKDAIKQKKIRTTSKKSIVLNYDVEDVDLSKISNIKEANSILIPYGSKPQITSFEYDKEKKLYTRYENSVKCTDHNTKEDITTKNIIIQKVEHEMCDDNYYWNLHTSSEGEGYYITNGYAIPITWSKTNRSDKTKYTYKSGTIIDGKDAGGKEIIVSDGRTWIEVQTTSQTTTIK